MHPIDFLAFRRVDIRDEVPDFRFNAMMRQMRGKTADGFRDAVGKVRRQRTDMRNANVHRKSARNVADLLIRRRAKNQLVIGNRAKLSMARRMR